jgi:hypothetical protein
MAFAQTNNTDVLRCWAELKIPARIDAAQTCKLLGMAEHDIPILVGARLLKTLGEPAPNATKWFSAMEIILLASDREWLDNATKKLSNHWLKKRQRRGACSVRSPGFQQPEFAKGAE